MSIITCPECLKPVSSTDVSCPNCGYPLKVESSISKSTILLSDESSKELLQFTNHFISQGYHITNKSDNLKIAVVEPRAPIIYMLNTEMGGVLLFSKYLTNDSVKSDMIGFYSVLNTLNSDSYVATFSYSEGYFSGMGYFPYPYERETFKTYLSLFSFDSSDLIKSHITPLRKFIIREQVAKIINI